MSTEAKDRDLDRETTVVVTSPAELDVQPKCKTLSKGVANFEIKD